MESKNELTIFNENAGHTFCSKKVETEKDKKELFNALESCDALLSNCEGQEITLKDVYCEPREVVNENGEVTTKYRIILFDENGQTYATGSYGIFNVIKKLMVIYGNPTWEEGIKVRVAKRPLGNGKSTLTLILV